MNHATTHLMVSRLINDPVAAATTDGAEVTDDERNDIINQAITFVVQRVMLEDPTREAAKLLLASLKKAANVTWASAGTALPSDYLEWVEVNASAAGARLGFWSDISDLNSKRNPFVKDVFTISDGKIYGMASGSILASGTGVLYYYETSQAATSATSTVALDLRWQVPVAQASAYIFFAQKGDVERAKFFYDQATQSIKAQVNAAIGKSNPV